MPYLKEALMASFLPLASWWSVNAARAPVKSGHWPSLEGTRSFSGALLYRHSERKALETLINLWAERTRFLFLFCFFFLFLFEFLSGSWGSRGKLRPHVDATSGGFSHCILSGARFIDPGGTESGEMGWCASPFPYLSSGPLIGL